MSDCQSVEGTKPDGVVVVGVVGGAAVLSTFYVLILTNKFEMLFIQIDETYEALEGGMAGEAHLFLE